MKHEKFRKSIHTKEHVALRVFLKEQREKLGLTQRDLGERLQVHHTLIGKVETGDRRLDVVEFIDYCKALEADPREVIELIWVIHSIINATKPEGTNKGCILLYSNAYSQSLGQSWKRLLKEKK